MILLRSLQRTINPPPQRCIACKEKAEEYVGCKTCKVSSYCSDHCRQVHLRDHRRHCREVHAARKKARREKGKLISKIGRETFHEQTGILWATPDARAYCSALEDLGKKFEQLGKKSDDIVALAAAANMFSELLVSNRGDEQVTRFIYPFALMALSKLKESYNFVIWCSTVFEGFIYVSDFASWPRAPWIFRTDDLLEDLTKNAQKQVDLESMELPHLLAVTLLKAVFVKTIDGDGRPMKCFEDVMQRADEQKKILRAYMQAVGNTDEVMQRGDEQKKILRAYMQSVGKTNKHAYGVLAGQLKLEELPAEHSSEVVVRGSPAEAREVLGVADYVVRKFELLDVLKKYSE